MLAPLVEPGFLANSAVDSAVVLGTVVGAVSGVVGTFTVMRGQSFAGHSLADIGSAGGSAAFLIGANPLFGFVVVNLVAAVVMEAVGARRAHGRDIATGVVLGAALGLAALFLYLDTTRTGTAGAAINVLFGSIFTLPSYLLTPVAVLGAGAAVLVAVVWRPLLLSSVAPELAEARGITSGRVGVAYLVALALAVSLSALTIGAILSTALLVGPAAASLRLFRRPACAIAGAAVIGVVSTWLGILLAYDSYFWRPSHRSWPVSFFVVMVVAVIYLVATLAGGRRRRDLAKDPREDSRAGRTAVR